MAPGCQFQTDKSKESRSLGHIWHGKKESTFWSPKMDGNNKKLSCHMSVSLYKLMNLSRQPMDSFSFFLRWEGWISENLENDFFSARCHCFRCKKNKPWGKKAHLIQWISKIATRICLHHPQGGSKRFAMFMALLMSCDTCWTGWPWAPGWSMVIWKCSDSKLGRFEHWCL